MEDPGKSRLVGGVDQKREVLSFPPLPGPVQLSQNLDSDGLGSAATADVGLLKSSEPPSAGG